MGEREKSALYPGATWEECLEFVRKVNEFKLKAVSYQAVAEKYNLSSVTTKSFTAKIGACKQFGLILTSKGNTIQLTEASKKILYPTGSSVHETELQCFCQPPLYAKLISTYDGQALPPLEILGNVLMNDHRIARAVKDVAAKAFMQSADQLGLIKAGVLCYNQDTATCDEKQDPSDASTIDSISTANDAVETLPSSVPKAVSSIVNGLDTDYIAQSVPCANGKVAKIIIPIDATEDDIYLIHDMLTVVLRRKFKLNLDNQ